MEAVRWFMVISVSELQGEVAAVSLCAACHRGGCMQCGRPRYCRRFAVGRLCIRAAAGWVHDCQHRLPPLRRDATLVGCRPPRLASVTMFATFAPFATLVL